MKNPGYLQGVSRGADQKLSVAERSYARSDAGSATPAPAPRNTPATSDSATETIELVLRPRTTPGLFGVELNGKIIVEASRSPVCDAARELHALGRHDDTTVVARHRRSDLVSMHGPLWAWRLLTVREARNGPRL